MVVDGKPCLLACVLATLGGCEEEDLAVDTGYRHGDGESSSYSSGGSGDDGVGGTSDVGLDEAACYWDVDGAYVDVDDYDGLNYWDMNVNLESDPETGCTCWWSVLADAGTDRIPQRGYYPGFGDPDNRGHIVALDIKRCSDDEWTTEYGFAGDVFSESYFQRPGGNFWSIWNWESWLHMGEVACNDCLMVQFFVLTDDTYSWHMLYDGQWDCIPGCEEVDEWFWEGS